MIMLPIVLELKLLFCFIVTPPRRAGAQVRLVSVAHTRTVGLAPLLGQRHCLLLTLCELHSVGVAQDDAHGS